MNPAPLVASAIVAGALAVLVAACTGPNDPRVGVDAPSEAEDQFGPVSDYLDHRCGSLDCHGQPGRNLQIWGCEGMRLDPSDFPSCNRLIGGKPTTTAEHQATYRSLVGLEPTVISLVVQQGGADPERLTFMRKPHGIEPHEGGQLMTKGDDQYDCVVSWLSGSTDATSCSNAVTSPAFPMPDGAPE